MQLNLEKERAAVSALEKKQRKFDQVCARVTSDFTTTGNLPRNCTKLFTLRNQLINHTCFVCVLQLLAEEKAISEKNAMERDNAERDARQNETKVTANFSTRHKYKGNQTRYENNWTNFQQGIGLRIYILQASASHNCCCSSRQ